MDDREIEMMNSEFILDNILKMYFGSSTQLPKKY